MATTKTIACLASSRKNGGYCVAGRDIHDRAWVRPVSPRPGHALTALEMQYTDGSMPHVLDLIEVPLLGRPPVNLPFQTENRLVDERTPWQKVGECDPSQVAELCDDVGVLWLNGHSSGSGINDRVPQSIASTAVRTSLALVAVEGLSFHVAFEGWEHPRKRVRAHFTLGSASYRLVVTDRIVEARMLQAACGDYPVNEPTALCVSLGEPYQGYAYKLVAAVVGLN